MVVSVRYITNLSYSLSHSLAPSFPPSLPPCLISSIPHLPPPPLFYLFSHDQSSSPPPPPPPPLVDIPFLLCQLRQYITVYQIRGSEFFQDFDPLRSGSIPASRFRQVYFSSSAFSASFFSSFFSLLYSTILQYNTIHYNTNTHKVPDILFLIFV